VGRGTVELRIGRLNIDESPRLRCAPGVVPADPQTVVAVRSRVLYTRASLAVASSPLLIKPMTTGHDVLKISRCLLTIHGSA
jgi:hypothetical protein